MTVYCAVGSMTRFPLGGERQDGLQSIVYSIRAITRAMDPTTLLLTCSSLCDFTIRLLDLDSCCILVLCRSLHFRNPVL